MCSLSLALNSTKRGPSRGTSVNGCSAYNLREITKEYNEIKTKIEHVVTISPYEL